MAALNGHVHVFWFYFTNAILTDLEAITLPEGYRLIHFACLHGSSSFIRVLFNLGVDINSRTRDGSTALHVAVRAHQSGAVQTLIELGLRVDSLDNACMTPLVYALKQGSKVITEALLAAVTPVNDNGQKQSDFPPKKTSYLLEALNTAIKRSDIRLCRIIWDEGCPLDVPLPACHGCTPIMAALGRGRTDIALWMLDVMDERTKKTKALDGQCDKHFRCGTTSLEIACGMVDCEALLGKLLDVYLELGSNWLKWPLGLLHICARKNNTKAIGVIIDYVKKNEESLRFVFLHGFFSGYAAVLTTL
jgi:hypothetical protein